MKKILFIFIFLFAFKLSAALPPLYQSIKEIEAIINDEQLREELTSAEPILEIKRVQEGYLVVSNRYFVKVDVIYLPTEMIGPAKFELRVHSKVYKNSACFESELN